MKALIAALIIRFENKNLCPPYHEGSDGSGDE